MDVPHPPEDDELRTIIDRLANFVARNGTEFEEMTKEKQKDNPKFLFMFGGPYHNYYLFRVNSEQAALTAQSISQQHESELNMKPSVAPPWQQNIVASSAPHFPPPSDILYSHPLPTDASFAYQHSMPFNPSSVPISLHSPMLPQANSMVPHGNVMGSQNNGLNTQIPPCPQRSQPLLPNPTLPDSDKISTLRQQMEDFSARMQTQISVSEMNLKAQYDALLSVQRTETRKLLWENEHSRMLSMCQQCEISVTELDGVVEPIVSSCTKENISKGKSWFLKFCSDSSRCDLVALYIHCRITDHRSTFEVRLFLIYLINDVLHHCSRKNAVSLLSSLEGIVLPVCAVSLMHALENQREKLLKVLGIWQASRFLSQDTLNKLQMPEMSYQEYLDSLESTYPEVYGPLGEKTKQQFSSLEKQHHDYCHHLNSTLARMQSNLNEMTMPAVPASVMNPIDSHSNVAYPGIPAMDPPIRPGSSIPQDFGIPPAPSLPGSFPPQFSGPPVFPPVGPLPMLDFSRPPPGFVAPPSTFPPMTPDSEAVRPSIHPLPLPKDDSDLRPESLVPSLPYFELPAGLMCSLIKMEDYHYRHLDARDLRLPPLQPPSQQLLNAVELYYSVPSHDSPRDADGWERLGLFDFYKAKKKARQEKDDLLKEEEEKNRRRFKDSRTPTPSRSPSESRSRSRSSSRSPNRRMTTLRSSLSPPRRSSRRSPTPEFRSNRSRRSPLRRSFSPPRPAPAPLMSLDIPPQRLSDENKGAQLMKKMGWGGGGLGASEQGIYDPVQGGEVREQLDKYKGVGAGVDDAFTQFRKSKSAGFMHRIVNKDKA